MKRISCVATIWKNHSSFGSGLWPTIAVCNVCMNAGKQIASDTSNFFTLPLVFFPWPFHIGKWKLIFLFASLVTFAWYSHILSCVTVVLHGLCSIVGGCRSCENPIFMLNAASLPLIQCAANRFWEYGANRKIHLAHIQRSFNFFFLTRDFRTTVNRRVQRVWMIYLRNTCLLNTHFGFNCWKWAKNRCASEAAPDKSVPKRIWNTVSQKPKRKWSVKLG